LVGDTSCDLLFAALLLHLSSPFSKSGQVRKGANQITSGVSDLDCTSDILMRMIMSWVGRRCGHAYVGKTRRRFKKSRPRVATSWETVRD
jgi:hypothetical protein